jgi:hypothetical protein
MDRLWTIARVELHLSDEEFLDLSYRQFSLLHDRALTLRWQDQWQIAALTTTVAQSGFREWKEYPKPDDFIFTIVPGHKQPAAPAKPANVFDIFRQAAKDHARYG